MKYTEIIKNIRTDKDLKQYEIANELGINPKNYSMYENGNRKIPIEVIDNLLDIFKINLDYFLGLNKEQRYKNTSKIDLNVYKNNIRIIRRNNNYTQYEMSKLIGCSQQILSEYETGKYIMPLEILRNFCIKCNISSDYVTGKIKEYKLLKK